VLPNALYGMPQVAAVTKEIAPYVASMYVPGSITYFRDAGGMVGPRKTSQSQENVVPHGPENDSSVEPWVTLCMN